MMPITDPKSTGEGHGPVEPDDALQEDVLIEDVSIDGMCGVY